MNNVITFDEVASVVKMAKKNDACGYYQIHNDILDNMDYKLTQTTLLNACLVYSKIPECWLKAIISPVPKSSVKDPFIPVSYRCVSFLLHVGKLYSQILNKHIISYCENVEKFCEEQNGF